MFKKTSAARARARNDPKTAPKIDPRWLQDRSRTIFKSVFFRYRFCLRFCSVFVPILGAILGAQNCPSKPATPTLLSLKRQKWTHAGLRPPKTPQEAAKTPQEAAKTAQDAPQDPPRAPKHLPRPPKTTQNHPKMASESFFVLLSSLLLSLSLSLSLFSSCSLPKGGGELTYWAFLGRSWGVGKRSGGPLGRSWGDLRAS